ncbi:ATP-binding protein [Microbacterium immunditiarum]|uniref:Oxygen sensor histidine kinase NreB n=1 Tax=Microbacterium immunditiarum TaxID=337480 RepID=A0A7Y9GMK0_9MICO|nr:signal transduction histidine kinase [Microbacterium immunditiarum]
MLKRRWWDVAVAAGSVVIAAALLIGFRPDDPVRLAVGLASIAGFAAAYFLIARPAICEPGSGLVPAPWRFPAFVAVGSLAIAIGAGATGFLAIMQALAYPLMWIVGNSRRGAIIGSAVFAVMIWVGITIGGDEPGAFVAGLMTSGFSFVFAIALGLWIASIAEYGEERARLVAELTEAQAEVEALSRERGASAERERLARDIHDTLAQTLAGLVLLAERAGRQSRDGHSDAAAATIATVEQIARDALDEARALVARTAAVPSEPAFAAAVERLVERFRAHSSADIALDDAAVEGDLDRETQVVVLRCLQEALSNVAKHAAAEHVEVRVAVDADGAATLTVTDDGRGFDPVRSTTGFGLEGMRERVAIAGGVLDVSSAVGRGTTLGLRLPGARSGPAAPSEPSSAPEPERSGGPR